jgi:TRIAD3 protein (E3 ubiquitin-protein ligase RNF216)
VIVADNSIRSVQSKEEFLFGPTYLQLVADDLNLVKPFTILKRPRAGKGKTSIPKMDAGGVEFELEKNWILAHAATLRVKRDAQLAKKLADEAEWAAGGGVECGCCFDDFLPVRLFQHLPSS